MNEIFFILFFAIGIVGAFIGFEVCKTPGAGWWVGAITACLMLLTQSLIK